MHACLLIVVVVGCLGSGTAGAESIALQSKPSDRRQAQNLRAVSIPASISHPVASDLGRGFMKAELHDLFQPGGGKVQGSFPANINTPLNFRFFHSSPAAGRTLGGFSNVFSQTLFEKKPKGSRGRRELSESNLR